MASKQTIKKQHTSTRTAQEQGGSVMIDPTTLILHVPLPSGDGHWSMSRYDFPDRVHEHVVELWDGRSSNVVRIPNAEVIDFMQEMMKKYG